MDKSTLKSKLGEAFFSSKKRLLGTLVGLVLLLSIPITMSLVSQQQDIRQRAAEIATPGHPAPMAVCAADTGVEMISDSTGYGWYGIGSKAGQTGQWPSGVQVQPGGCLDKAYGGDAAMPTYPYLGKTAAEVNAIETAQIEAAHPGGTWKGDTYYPPGATVGYMSRQPANGWEGKLQYAPYDAAGNYVAPDGTAYKPGSSGGYMPDGSNGIVSYGSNPAHAPGVPRSATGDNTAAMNHVPTTVPFALGSSGAGEPTIPPILCGPVNGTMRAQSNGDGTDYATYSDGSKAIVKEGTGEILICWDSKGQVTSMSAEFESQALMACTSNAKYDPIANGAQMIPLNVGNGDGNIIGNYALCANTVDGTAWMRYPDGTWKKFPQPVSAYLAAGYTTGGVDKLVKGYSYKPLGTCSYIKDLLPSPTLAAGEMPTCLSKSTTNPIAITTGTTSSATGATASTSLGLSNYNAVISCYSGACTADIKSLADVNHDGVVDAKDLNTLLRSLQTR